MACAIAASAGGQTTVVGQVKLPLKDYLALVERIEADDRATAEAAARREPAVAEVVSRDTAVVWNDGSADVTTVLTVEVRGAPLRPVRLAVAGSPARTSIEPAGPAALRQVPGGLELVAPNPGRYTVTVRSVAELQDDARGSHLALPADAAPVAVTTVDLPAADAWSCPGAVVAAEEVKGARRVLRLALDRTTASSIRAWREAKGEEEDKALARAVVVTIVQLAADGVRRHDVVLYEVSRGLLPSFVVDLPEGLEIERTATDEGELAADAVGRRLVVQRTQRLAGIGHLVMTSSAARTAALSLAPVLPEVEVRARYLAWAPAMAADATPEPTEAWTRVDLGDLPEAIRAASDGIKLSAAWLQAGQATGARLVLDVLPTAPALETIVRQRETTTLLTRDGTLLHRDVFTLAQAGSALDVRLPADATLWSASINGLAVRPVQRNGATLVPLPLGAQEDATVDVVVVQERAIAAGRSRIPLALPQVAAPVLEHRWRLLLPQENAYRFAAGTLRPAPETSRYVDSGVDTSGVSNQLAPPSSPLRSGTSSVRGRVVDPTGLPLPGATVVVTSPASRAARTVVTDGDGSFTVSGIMAGSYDLRFELPGFVPQERWGVRTADGRVTTVDASLAFASFAEEIAVSAESPVIDVTKSATGQTFRSDMTPADRGGGRRPVEADQGAVDGKLAYQNEIANLKQGLVGGVKPVPVTIPESGKTLLLAGALPPAAVTVELDVKAKR